MAYIDNYDNVLSILNISFGLKKVMFLKEKQSLTEFFGKLSMLILIYA